MANDKHISLFDQGREAYTDAGDGTWISSLNNIGTGSVPFAKWEAGLRFECSKQINLGIFKRVLWAMSVGDVCGRRL